MGGALEASSQRIRNHLRRPIPGRGKLLNENARNTVNEIVPPYLADYDSSDSFASDVAHIFGSEPQTAMDRLHEAVVTRMNVTFGDRSQVLRMDSVSAATQFPDQCFDLVFIDGNHRYDSVLQDLNAWYPKLQAGGILVGDDYAWPDVQEAVNTFSEQMGISVAVIQSVKSAHPLFMVLA